MYKPSLQVSSTLFGSLWRITELIVAEGQVFKVFSTSFDRSRVFLKDFLKSDPIKQFLNSDNQSFKISMKSLFFLRPSELQIIFASEKAFGFCLLLKLALQTGTLPLGPASFPELFLQNKLWMIQLVPIRFVLTNHWKSVFYNAFLMLYQLHEKLCLSIHCTQYTNASFKIRTNTDAR